MLISSVGFLMMLWFSLRSLKAIASEMGPTRPRYMVAMIISLPADGRVGVRFRESPTVAVALVVSYTMSRMSALVTAHRSRVDMNIMEKESTVTEIAFLTASFEMFRLNIVVSLLPLTEEIADARITAKVTVLIPPAVPTGEPPMNISSSEMIADSSVIPA